MPPVEITDPEVIAKVNIFVSATSSGYISELSFGHWLLVPAIADPDTIAGNIETPLAALLGATVSDGLRRVLATTATIVRTEVSKPLVEPQPVPDETTRALAGGASGGLMPPDIAMVVSFRSGTAGPAFRGRAYVGGIGEEILSTAGLWDSTLASGLAADWNTYITAIAALTGDYEQVVVSRFENVNGAPVPRDPPLYATVLSATVDLHADTQRRRGVR